MQFSITDAFCLFPWFFVFKTKILLQSFTHSTNWVKYESQPSRIQFWPQRKLTKKIYFISKNKTVYKTPTFKQIRRSCIKVSSWHKMLKLMKIWTKYWPTNFCAVQSYFTSCSLSKLLSGAPSGGVEAEKTRWDRKNAEERLGHPQFKEQKKDRKRFLA